MKLVYSPNARDILKKLSNPKEEKIKNKIQELKENPTGHGDSKIIQIRGRQLYRLEIKEERKGEIDHRAIYDIENGKIRIYSIIYRDDGYPDKDITR